MIRDLLELMAGMGLMEIQVLLGDQGTEASQERMVCQVILVQWEKKDHQVALDLLDYLDTKGPQENRETQ